VGSARRAKKCHGISKEEVKGEMGRWCWGVRGRYSAERVPVFHKAGGDGLGKVGRGGGVEEEGHAVCIWGVKCGQGAIFFWKAP
jgi:hypothetical protein